MSRVLFLVKFRETYDGKCGYDGTPHCFGGLYHSALFVVQMLRAAGVQAKLAQCCDNNDIDREVFAFKPDTVILEALWTVPEKFDVLTRLHPKVRWVVRCHSEIPFIANEGIAIEWLTRYVRYPSVFIAANSLYAVRDFQGIVAPYESKVLYLPNYYPTETVQAKRKNGFIEVGCFGAIRPLKNQLIQVLAAIEWGRQIRKQIRIHVNHQCQQGGDVVLKNISALCEFAGVPLVEHGWEPREQFLQSISQTDVGMQVSFSETFDITAADTVALGIPLVTSKEVTWASGYSQAEPTNTASIVSKLKATTGFWSGYIKRENLSRLRAYCNESRTVWLSHI